MAGIDYYRIAVEVAEILRTAIPNVQVVIEEELQLAYEAEPRIGVYLESRTPSSHQGMSAGRRTRMQLRISIWVWCSSLERVSAIQRRDELIGRVETVLMENRTLRTPEGEDLVEGLWLGGGDLPSGQLPSQGFIAGGEVIAIAELSSEV
jgi:hypothetical protein